MLTHYQGLLENSLAGDLRAFQTILKELVLPGAPSKQQITDFLFKERSLNEFAEAILLNHQIAICILAWRESKMIQVSRTVAIFLNNLDRILFGLGAEKEEEKVAKLSQILQGVLEPALKLIIYHYRALHNHKLEKYNEVVADCDAMLGLRPMRVATYFARAKANYRLYQYDLALKDLTTAIDLAPHAEFYRLRATIFYLSYRYGNIIQDLTQAIILEPNVAHDYSLRGICFHKLGQNNHAAKDFIHVITLDPSDMEAHAKLIEITREEEQKARSSIEKVSQTTEPSLLERLGSLDFTPPGCVASIVSSSLDPSTISGGPLFFTDASRFQTQHRFLSVESLVRVEPPTSFARLHHSVPTVLKRPRPESKKIIDLTLERQDTPQSETLEPAAKQARLQ